MLGLLGNRGGGLRVALDGNQSWQPAPAPTGAPTPRTSKISFRTPVIAGQYLSRKATCRARVCSPSAPGFLEHR